MSAYKGVIPYLVTPIDESGNILDNVLLRLCDDLIRQGVHGLTPLGSTGEFAYLDLKQRERVVALTVEAANGRVPVIPVVASTTIAGAIEQAKKYRTLGSSGIVAVLESYFPIKEQGIQSYFCAIADAVDIPVIVYTNPNFQRTDLTLEIIERLSRHPNLVGIKDASNNTGRLLSIINRCESFDVFAASSHIPTCVMLLGGKGWFAGPACVIPTLSVKLFDYCIAGRWLEAIELQRKLWPLHELFSRFNLAACIKAALQEQGYAVGSPVAPQASLNLEQRREIRIVLDDIFTGAQI